MPLALPMSGFKVKMDEGGSEVIWQQSQYWLPSVERGASIHHDLSNQHALKYIVL